MLRSPLSIITCKTKYRYFFIIEVVRIWTGTDLNLIESSIATHLTTTVNQCWSLIFTLVATLICLLFTHIFESALRIVLIITAVILDCLFYLISSPQSATHVILSSDLSLSVFTPTTTSTRATLAITTPATLRVTVTITDSGQLLTNTSTH